MKEYLWVAPGKEINGEIHWFNIYTTDLVCLAGVESWDRVKECISSYVRNYHSPQKLQELIHELRYSFRMGAKEKERREALFKEYYNYHRDEIKAIVDDSRASQSTSKSTMNSVKFKIKKVLPKAKQQRALKGLGEDVDLLSSLIIIE